MAYCSVDDIRRALSGSAEAGGGDTNTAADLDDSALRNAADEASAMVDAYVNGPYVPGQDQIPRIIVFWTRDIAAYLATLTWRRAKPPAANDPVVLRYGLVIQMLEGVAAGKLDIVGPGATEEQPAIVNQYLGSLFSTGDFDLHGEGERVGGWPLLRWQGTLFWAGDQ